MNKPISQKFNQNKNFHAFVPFANWQVKAWKDQSEIIFLCGTAGSGKTVFGLEKAHAYAMRYPGVQILFTRKTEASMFAQMLRPFEQFCLGPALGKDVFHDGHKRAYFYRNGSVIYYRGMANEKQIQSIRGFTLNFILVDEAHLVLKSDHEELLGRMRGTGSDFNQILYMTNPDSPKSWQYETFVKQQKASYYWSHWSENPHNPKDYSKFLDMLTGTRRLRLRDGLWVESEGSVYQFDPSIHLIKQFDIPAGWTKICSIDFGFNAPFVCQWWAIDQDNAMYLYREIYQTELLITDAAKKILSYSSNEKISAYISDHDAGERAVLASHGIDTFPADKDVIVGIDAVRMRMKPSSNQRPKLFVMANALVESDPMLIYKSLPKSTLDEFDNYIYKTPKPGEIAKDEPLKRNDHGMDAMRYAVMYVDKYLGSRYSHNPNNGLKLDELFNYTNSGIF